MAKAPETTVVSARGRQLQATVTQDIYDAYVDYHWEAKKETVDVVRDAIVEHGVSLGFLTRDADGNVSATAK